MFQPARHQRRAGWGIVHTNQVRHVTIANAEGLNPRSFDAGLQDAQCLIGCIKAGLNSEWDRPVVLTVPDR